MVYLIALLAMLNGPLLGDYGRLKEREFVHTERLTPVSPDLGHPRSL
jgi:hypothetical protein